MQGNNTIIDHLNNILTNELLAINQYILHSRMLKHWGFSKIANKVDADSIEEMRHADTLIQRILFLDGTPRMEYTQLSIGRNVEEVYQKDLALELKAHPDLQVAIQACEDNQDFITRNLLKDILDKEEEHIDWLETQLELIKQIGIQNYLQAQIG